MKMCVFDSFPPLKTFKSQMGTNKNDILIKYNDFRVI